MTTTEYRENFEAMQANGFDGVETIEFDTKLRDLAEFLCKMATGMTLAEMNEVDDQVSENYIKDAEEILVDMPHLMSYGQRESMNLV